MGYNIEVSFNILKNRNVSEVEQKVVSYAQDCDCTSFYSDCEMEKNVYIQRNHMIITVKFDATKIVPLLKFLKNIKKTKGLYIESIYNEDTHGIIYASQYYLTLLDDNPKKRPRSYSENDATILDLLSSLKNKYKNQEI
jgi:hypothetical protein